MQPVTLWILIGLLLAAAIAAMAVGDSGSLGGLSGDMIASVVASVALLIFLVGGMGGYAGRIGQAVKDFAIWAAIALVLILGYSFRDELRPIYQRVAGELLPPGTNINVTNEGARERAVRIRKRGDGHFAVQSEANGRPVTMLVDTGASSVVLTADDARAAGINVDQLNFSIPVQTANGTGYAAAIRLKTLSVGGILRPNLQALVAKPGALRESLLGMSFLRELRSYEVTGDFMTFKG